MNISLEPLPSPIQPILVDRDAVSIEIEWQEYLFPLLNYLLCVTKSNEMGCNNNFTTSNTSFLMQDLEPETEYLVTIVAVTVYGPSPPSEEQNFMTGLLVFVFVITIRLSKSVLTDLKHMCVAKNKIVLPIERILILNILIPIASKERIVLFKFQLSSR